MTAHSPLLKQGHGYWMPAGTGYCPSQISFTLIREEMQKIHFFNILCIFIYIFQYVCHKIFHRYIDTAAALRLHI